MTKIDQLTNQGEANTNTGAVDSPEQILLLDPVTNKNVPLPDLLQKLGKDAQKAVNDAGDAKTIAILGFFIVTIMVATMLVAVLALFIEVFKSVPQTEHQFPTSLAIES